MTKKSSRICKSGLIKKQRHGGIATWQPICKNVSLPEFAVVAVISERLKENQAEFH